MITWEQAGATGLRAAHEDAGRMPDAGPTKSICNAALGSGLTFDFFLLASHRNN